MGTGFVPLRKAANFNWHKSKPLLRKKTPELLMEQLNAADKISYKIIYGLPFSAEKRD